MESGAPLSSCSGVFLPSNNSRAGAAAAVENCSAVSALGSNFAATGALQLWPRDWALLSRDRGLLVVFRHHLGP